MSQKADSKTISSLCSFKGIFLRPLVDTIQWNRVSERKSSWTQSSLKYSNAIKSSIHTSISSQSEGKPAHDPGYCMRSWDLGDSGQLVCLPSWCCHDQWRPGPNHASDAKMSNLARVYLSKDMIYGSSSSWSQWK